MTGAGTTTLAWTYEPDYLSDPTESTYVYPGKNVQIQDITLQNALQRLRLPDDNQAIETIAGTFEGAFAAQWVLTNPWYLDATFATAPTENGTGPYTYDWTMQTGQATSARWYAGVNHLSGTVERELLGVVVPQLSITCQQGQPIQMSVTGFYGDEIKNTAVTPGVIIGDTDEPYHFHGGDLTIDSTSQKKMQEATLDVNTGAHTHQGWDRNPIDAVMGDVETTLTASKIVDGATNLELAYGDASSPASNGVSGVSGSLEFANSTDTVTASLSGVTPQSYGWDNVPPDADNDVLESLEYVVDEIAATAETASQRPL